MTIIEKIKGWFKNNKTDAPKTNEAQNFISIVSMDTKFKSEDYMGAAKDLKSLLEAYGRRKRKNHRYKGREFIHFILSSKHKDLKNIGYTHWQNLNQFMKLNQVKVYPYHQNNLKEAIAFFQKEIKGLAEIKIPVK